MMPLVVMEHTKSLPLHLAKNFSKTHSASEKNKRLKNKLAALGLNLFLLSIKSVSEERLFRASQQVMVKSISLKLRDCRMLHLYI